MRIAIFIALALTTLLIGRCGQQEATQTSIQARYVGEQSCYSCHQEQFDLWKGSHHDWAMGVASEQTVLGDFNDVRTEIDGVSYQFRRENGKYLVDVAEIDGSESTYDIEYTFGVAPLQQYITRFDEGRHQVLRVTWDDEKKEWYHQYEGQQMDPLDWLHWTRGGQNWNTMCAECHSTDLKRNYDWQADTFHTTWASINVSCEACHGPGSEHIAWAAQAFRDSHTYILNAPLQQGQIDMCGPCHARRVKLTEDFDPAQRFDERYILQTATPEYYHPDGQILEEDYVLGSFLQSKMYMNHVKCTDCHDPHSMQLKFVGNTLCMQCHEPKYDREEHHFHPVGTESAECVSCHMRGDVYMGIDFRRDHSFRNPRPDQSLLYGTPNACTSCHTDKSDKWAADQVEEWYGPDRPSLHSDVILASTKETVTPEEKQRILAFINDTEESFFNRATVIDNLSFSFTEDELYALGTAMEDSASFVRYKALRSFMDFPAQDRHGIALRHVRDTSRMVRVAAAELLSDMNRNQLLSDDRAVVDSALQEYETMLFTNADFPVGRVQIGDYYMRTGRSAEAISQYRVALEKDSLTVPAYTSLATAYSSTGRNTEAMKMLDMLVELEPAYGRAFYLRGLLYYEMGREGAAIEDLTTAIEIDPADFRAHYNLATLHYQRKEFDKAERIMLNGLQLFPESGDGRYLLALIYQEQGRQREANAIMQELRATQQ